MTYNWIRKFSLSIHSDEEETDPTKKTAGSASNADIDSDRDLDGMNFLMIS